MTRPSVGRVIEDRGPALMGLPGVEGIAEGRENDEPCIVVFTAGEPPAGLPKQISGYAVIVRRSGPIEAQ